MDITKKHDTHQVDNNVFDDWFQNLIDNIKTDHFLMTENIAPVEKKALYTDLIFGNQKNVLSNMREASTMYFITEIISEYVMEIKNQQKNPLKLALALSDSKILVWSVINDNDELTEDALLIAEAKVNGKYHKNGFYINSTILEKSDNAEVPSHYQIIIG